MVRHHAELPDFHHWVIMGNLLQLDIADKLAQGGKFHLRGICCSTQLPKQGETPFDHQRQHISPHGIIVVRRQPTVHRMLYVANVYSSRNGLILAFHSIF